MYDFSTTLKNKNKLILDEFIDKYITNINSYDEEEYSYTTPLALYTEAINDLCRPFELEALTEKFQKLALFKITLSVPYVILTNELYGLKSIIISKLVQNSDSHTIITDILKIFKHINNQVAKIYLDKYIENLISMNTIRINSLTDLIEKNLISHYESHLIWLSNLASSIQMTDTAKSVELNNTKCYFGTWLHKDGKKVIQNNSKYKVLLTLHKNLHTIAKKVNTIILSPEYHLLITYLEKCELISLSIGTELALIDNVLMNKRVTKDTLTGSLNREALRSVFESQYELSLATNRSFVFALCDLDFFKKVNDTYGHAAGDKMLKHFVDIVKQNIRTSDMVIRYGGEEFIIMLPAIKKDKGKEILEKIRIEFAKSFIVYEKQSIKTTVSIGVMEIKPQDEYNKSFVDKYVTIVDQKLYMAKENGRNRVKVC